MSALAPTVACVIPTHRRAALLDEAIRSVLAQTAPPTEVWIVDDAGCAESKALVESLARESAVPLRYLAHTLGRGPSTSRNLGAREAQCEWIAFLDDDDRWLPGYLAAALTRADADVVLTARWDFPSGGPPRPGKSPLPVYDEHAFLRRNPGGAPSALLIRRAFFLAIGGFDPGLPASEDRDLILRVMRAGARYATVPERLVEHRDDGEGISQDAFTLLPARIRFVAKHMHAMNLGDFAYTLRKTLRELRRARWRRAGWPR